MESLAIDTRSVRSIVQRDTEDDRDPGPASEASVFTHSGLMWIERHLDEIDLDPQHKDLMLFRL